MARVAGLLACGVGLTMPSPSEAFCGFYVAGADAKLFNDATVVVLMREGTRTVLSMQNAYQGPPEDFALVIPVPVVLHEGDVQTLRPELFDRVETLASPRLVEYWEIDPCIVGAEGTIGLGNLGMIGKGSGGGTGTGYGVGSSVKIEAEFAVAEYEIVILSATESSGLDTWLRENGYNIPAGAEPLLRPYVQQDMKFFVAKVDPTKVSFAGNGRAKLSPLRVHYESKDFALPVRLGLINAPDPSNGGKQDLLIHILAPDQRYQVANYPNVTIPTNLDLTAPAREQFAEFYVSLLDHTLERNPGAVVTEYAWKAGVCDPCPGEGAPLTQQELLELGGDVLPKHSATLTSTTSTTSSPRVSMATPSVGAGLDKDIVRRIVRAHINEVRSCYAAGLVRSPSLAGRVEIDFTISAKGKVDSATVASSTLADARVGECIAKATKRWTFPQPKTASVAVTYPYELAPIGGSTQSWIASPAANEFVLTRLHARYDASSLGEDLVFEAVPAITGGREQRDDKGELEQGATIFAEGTNNFQARYAIRHPWTGEIACTDPLRGRWGGPPEGGANPPKVARQLAEVSRGASLGSFVSAGAGEQLGVEATMLAPEPAAKAQDAPAKTPAASEPAPSNADPSAPASGCGCASTPEPSLPSLASLALLALLGLRRTMTTRTTRTTRTRRR